MNDEVQGRRPVRLSIRGLMCFESLATLSREDRVHREVDGRKYGSLQHPPLRHDVFPTSGKGMVFLYRRRPFPVGLSVGRVLSSTFFGDCVIHRNRLGEHENPG